MNRLYIDAEFDSIKENGKFHQTLISFGAVLCDHRGKYIDKFYTLARPKQFQRLTHTVRRMTKLKESDIRKAPRFPEMMEDFIIWLKKYTKLDEVDMYAFGPDDRRTMLGENRRWDCEYEDLLDPIINLQAEIGLQTKYENEVISKTLSLEDAKLLYNVEGIVEHNALTDAMDLYGVHTSFLNHGLNLKEARILSEKLRKKQAEQEEKQRLYRFEKLKAEFADQIGKLFEFPMSKPIIRILHLWSIEDKQFQLTLGEMTCEMNGIEFVYELTHFQFQLSFVGDMAYIILYLKQGVKFRQEKILLTRKNKEFIHLLLQQHKLLSIEI